MKQQPLIGLSILLVEDEYLQARETTGILERAGARVIGPVASTIQASVLIDADRPDIAVIDINLGAGPSFEIADRLADVGVPFVLLTGYDPFSVPEKYAKFPLAEKPVNGERLVRMLGTFCD